MECLEIFRQIILPLGRPCVSKRLIGFRYNGALNLTREMSAWNFFAKKFFFLASCFEEASWFHGGFDSDTREILVRNFLKYLAIFSCPRVSKKWIDFMASLLT